MKSIKWKPATAPLVPCGMLIFRQQHTSVLQTFLNLELSRLSQLRGSSNDDVVIVLGNDDILPWIPGAIYLGKTTQAPHLLVPTQLTPDLPIDWLDRAVVRKFGQGSFAINPWQKRVYNVSKALGLSVDKLKELVNEAA